MNNVYKNIWNICVYIWDVFLYTYVNILVIWSKFFNIHLTTCASYPQDSKHTDIQMYIYAHRYITHSIQIYLPPMIAHKFVSRIHWVWLGIMKFMVNIIEADGYLGFSFHWWTGFGIQSDSCYWNLDFIPISK